MGGFSGASAANSAGQNSKNKEVIVTPKPPVIKEE